MSRYLFVDGGYFREVVRRAEDALWDSARMIFNYTAMGTVFSKCFYYDCIGRQRKGESPAEYEARKQAQEAEFARIQRTDKWHVTEGVLTGSGERARQKQVDIQIAVDMLGHAHRRNMTEAHFIAGDQDFKPLVDALIRDGIFVHLWYDRTCTSSELLDAADGRSELEPLAYLQWVANREQFLNGFPTRSTIGGTPSHIAIRGKGRLKDGREATCYQAPDGYKVVYPEAGRVPTEQMVYWHHPRDLEFLKRVVSFYNPDMTWTD